MIACVKITGLEMSSVERSLRNPKKLGFIAAVGGAVGLSAAAACGGGEGSISIIDSQEPTPVPTTFGNQSVLSPRPTDSLISDLSDLGDERFTSAYERGQIGETAPNLKLETFEGKSFELKDILGKGPILLFVQGYIGPDYDTILNAIDIKRFFGDRLHVVALTHFSVATESPAEFPLHLATSDFVERYTNHATYFYLIDGQGKLVYSADYLLGIEPHTLIKGLLQYSRSPVETNGEFALPYGENPNLDPAQLIENATNEIFFIGDFDFFEDEEIGVMREFIRADANRDLSPVNLAQVGRLILERYCENPNEILRTSLQNFATITYRAYLNAVGEGVVDKSLWNILRYSFDPNCQNFAFGDSISDVLEDGSWVFGDVRDKVIGATKRDRDTL